MMNEALCAVLLILAVSQTSSQKVTCLPGWVLNGTSCYYVYTDHAQRLNYWKANRWCKQWTGFLTIACSPGWVLNGSSCYYVFTNRTQKLNFWKAKNWCKERNGSLTSVLSQRENDFLDQLINRTNLRPNETFHIGLRTNVRKLSWVDGEPYNYTNWYNNSNEQELLKGNEQRCAYYNHLHQWQLDDKCGTNRLFICKQAKSSAVACSPGWVLNGSSCYYVFTNRTQKLNFWKAKNWCKERNGSLTSVLSQKENDFLDQLINRTNLRPNETFYIGLRTNVRKLFWVDGEHYNYTNWHNNSNEQELLKGNQQKCAYYNHLHQWQLDDKCGTNRLFICKQLQSTTITTTATTTTSTKAKATTTTTTTTLSGSSPSSSPSTTRVSTSTEKGTPSFPITQGKPDETLKKLNKVLDSLEDASLNQSSAKKNMKELGTVLDSVLNSAPQPVAQLSQVIETSERIGELMVKGLRRGGNITEPTSVQIQTGFIVLGVDILPPVQSINSAESVSFPEEDKQTGNINLPASLMWRAQLEDGVSVSSLRLSNVSVSADSQSSKILNSGIISSTILFNNGSKFQNLSEPVVINLSSVTEVNDDTSPTCVFLDLNTDPPSWSPSGCVIHKYSSSHTVCHCYHMTSFAVLMDIHGAFEGDAISEDHELALSIVSIVGCLIAFICYITLLFSFYFLRRRTETLYIHMNLAAAESLAIFFFLLGYPAVRIKGVCFAFAVLLHFFQLAAFCWMMVEGINLLRGMVKVFRVTSRLRIYSLSAWGLPVLVVAVTASISRHQYLRDDFCWISHQVIWSFAGPVAFILSANLAVLVVAIKIVVRKTRYKETSKISTFEQEIRAAFKTLVILAPLLGVTWLLGFISIHNKSLVFQYLFAVINSLQGLYFLIAQYYFDDDIKTNARRASTRVKRLFSLSGSKSTSSLSGTISGNKKSADSPQQKPEDEEHDMKKVTNPKQSSDDQENNDKHLACNQQSSLKQQNDSNAMPSELQRRAPNEPNSEVDRAQGANGSKQHVSDTRF